MTTAPRVLRAEALTAAAFAPFGHVLTDDGPARAVNFGTAERRDLPAPLVNARPGARLAVATYTCTPAPPGPLPVPALERHRFSSQWFLPTGPALYVVVVAPGDDAPILEAARAFVVRAPMGIAYAAGTWHAPLRVLEEVARFVCLVHEDGSADDCEERRLPPGALVVEVGPEPFPTKASGA